MSRFVRPSKYRHVYGQPSKKEQCYENIRVSASAFDSDLCSSNPKFLAINWQASGGGAFAVVPLDHPGKLPDVYPLVRAHSGPVLTTAWNPFDDYMVASGGEDSKVAFTKINPDYLDAAWNSDVETQDLLPLSNISFSHGGKKVGNLAWSPTASNVLASAAADVKLWDLNAQKAGAELNAHPDLVHSMSFNHTGALLATTCKDKKLRVFDVRASKDPIRVGDSHLGVKGSRVVWAGNQDRIITTGFSRMSDRQCFVWDSNNLDKPLKQLTVDTSSGMLMPFFSDNNVLFLAGKGDGNIRYYELADDDLHYLSEFKSGTPQRGMGFMPRRGVSVSDCEIARAFKVSGNGIDPVSFIVPRKSDAFQADIYPPAISAEPALSASEFFSGKTSAPIYMDLESKQTTAAPAAPSPASTTTPSSAKPPSGPSTPAASASEPSKTSSFIPTPVSAAKEPPVETVASSSSPQDLAKNAVGSAATHSAAEVSPPPSRKASASPGLPTPSAPSPAAPSPSAPPATASAAADTSSSNEEVESLRKKVSQLESQLSERDSLIRTLELKVEKLASIHKSAQEAFVSI